MTCPPAASSSSHSLYLSSLILGMKLSAGIQLLPPQNIGTLLISKKKLNPSCSSSSLCTSLALLIPKVLATLSTLSPNTASSRYSGCSPYPCGNHNFGSAISNLASASAPLPDLKVDTEAEVGEIFSPSGEVRVKTTAVQGPSISAVAVITTSFSVEGMCTLEERSAMRDV